MRAAVLKKSSPDLRFRGPVISGERGGGRRVRLSWRKAALVERVVGVRWDGGSRRVCDGGG